MAKRNPESLMNGSGKFGKEKKIDEMNGKEKPREFDEREW
jgi:hypothetical protein